MFQHPLHVLEIFGEKVLQDDPSAALLNYSAFILFSALFKHIGDTCREDLQAERHIIAAHRSTSHSVQQFKVLGKGKMAMTRPTKPRS